MRHRGSRSGCQRVRGLTRSYSGTCCKKKPNLIYSGKSRRSAPTRLWRQGPATRRSLEHDQGLYPNLGYHNEESDDGLADDRCCIYEVERPCSHHWRSARHYPTFRHANLTDREDEGTDTESDASPGRDFKPRVEWRRQASRERRRNRTCLLLGHAPKRAT